jgi:hypothetical protein
MDDRGEGGSLRGEGHRHRNLRATGASIWGSASNRSPRGPSARRAAVSIASSLMASSFTGLSITSCDLISRPVAFGLGGAVWRRDGGEVFVNHPRVGQGKLAVVSLKGAAPVSGERGATIISVEGTGGLQTTHEVRCGCGGRGRTRARQNQGEADYP